MSKKTELYDSIPLEKDQARSTPQAKKNLSDGFHSAKPIERQTPDNKGKSK